MHLSRSRDLAIHGLCCLAAQPNGRLVAAKEMAEVLHARRTYFAKVLQGLAHAGLVQAKRGRLGGYGLARPASEITIADILQAIDVGDRPYPCPGTRGCQTHDLCAIQSIFSSAAETSARQLDTVTLAGLEEGLRTNGGAVHAPWLSAIA